MVGSSSTQRQSQRPRVKEKRARERTQRKGQKKQGEERRRMQATAVGLPSHSGPGGSLRRGPREGWDGRASYRSAAVAVRDAGIADLI